MSKYPEITAVQQELDRIACEVAELKSRLTAYVNENVYKKSELLEVCLEADKRMREAIFNLEYASDSITEIDDLTNEKSV